MIKDIVTKWLIKVDNNDELIITPKEVSKHAPINRILDKVGFYPFTAVKVGKETYLCVYDGDEEKNKIKSKMLVGKTADRNYPDGFDDMEEKDKENMEKVADLYLRKRTKV